MLSFSSSDPVTRAMYVRPIRACRWARWASARLSAWSGGTALGTPACRRLRAAHAVAPSAPAFARTDRSWCGPRSRLRPAPRHRRRRAAPGARWTTPRVRFQTPLALGRARRFLCVRRRSPPRSGQASRPLASPPAATARTPGAAWRLPDCAAAKVATAPAEFRPASRTPPG